MAVVTVGVDSTTRRAHRDAHISRVAILAGRVASVVIAASCGARLRGGVANLAGDAFGIRGATHVGKILALVIQAALIGTAILVEPALTGVLQAQAKFADSRARAIHVGVAL